jgi:Tfp pilus assembly protein PilX
MKVAATTNQPCRNQRGFFLVIVLLALTAIMLIYLTVNARRLAVLKQDLRLVEQKQIQRFNPAASGVNTNRAPVPSASVP